MNYPEDFTNKIIHGDILEVLQHIPDESIDLIVTSPPYWNQKEYAFWEKYSDYMNDVYKWIKELDRVLRSGRHCFWVIPDKLPYPPKENRMGERLYFPIYADTEWCAKKSGLVAEYPIIWKKPHGTQKMFGSYPYPPTIIHTPMTERICVWRKKGKYPKPEKSIKEESKFTKEQWVDWAQDLWEIRPDTSNEHPAPFPEEIPLRIITLWSFIGDIVLDPFSGSGTTLVAAKKTNRNFIGVDYKEEYANMARERIALCAAKSACRI